MVGYRENVNIEVSHYNMLLNKEDADDGHRNEEYNDCLAKCLFGDNRVKGALENEKILALTTKPPVPTLEYHEKLRQSYATSCLTTPRRGRGRIRGSIGQNAIRVLDAPGIADDYYPSIIDWSRTDVIASALGPSLYVWKESSLAGGTPNLLFEMENERLVTGVSWSPGEPHTLAIGTEDSLVNIWNAEEGLQVRSLRGHLGRVTCLDWNGPLLSTGSLDASVKNWDLRLAQPLVSTFNEGAEYHTAEICGIAWSNDGTTLASGGADNKLNLWSMDMATHRATMDDHCASVKAIAWCPWQSNLLASGGGLGDGTIMFWNTDSRIRLDFVETGSQVSSLIWSTATKELISSHGFSSNEIVVYAYPTMTPLVEWRSHKKRVVDIALSPDNDTLLSASGDETLMFWPLREKIVPNTPQTPYRPYIR